jgi:hypothetical protein
MPSRAVVSVIAAVLIAAFVGFRIATHRADHDLRKRCTAMGLTVRPDRHGPDGAFYISRPERSTMPHVIARVPGAEWTGVVRVEPLTDSGTLLTSYGTMAGKWWFYGDQEIIDKLLQH